MPTARSDASAAPAAPDFSLSSPLLAGAAAQADGHGAALLDDPAEWPAFSQPWQAGGKQADAAALAAAQADPAGVAVWESQVALGGMYCTGCALTIEDALRAVPGVQQVEVSGATQRARVVWRSSQVKPSQWMQAVREAGYTALPALDGTARQLRRAAHRKAMWRWLLAAFCMMQVMMYAWPAYEAAPGDLSLEMERLMRWASWVICIPMLIFSCGPFFSGAWRDLRRGRISMDLPVALGMGLTFIISSMGTLAPQGIFGREVFYDSLAMFVAFLLTGRWLELRLRDRTAGALDAVLNRLPDSIEQRQGDGSFARVALRRIRTGDVLRVLPGESFPADGTIIQGRTQADEALLTGESRPIAKAVGDVVIAGSFNLGAAVQMQVQRTGTGTRFAEIVALMQSASTQKPRLAQLADRVAGPFLLAVLALSALSAAYWWPSDPGHALMVAATVLIVTCPCALSLATPVAMLTAAGTLARHGVLVRNLQALETLAAVDTIVLDKTGTLTDAAIVVSDRRTPTGGPVAPHWQALAVAVAGHSIHPVSRAVAAMQGVPDSATAAWEVMQVEEIGGQGLRAQVRCKAQPHASGREALDDAPGSTTAEVPVDVPVDALEQGQVWWVRLGSRSFAGALPAGQDGPAQAVYLARELAQEGAVDAATVQPLAVFSLHEGVRPQAPSVVQQLRAAGLEVRLLSGDGPAAVARVAAAVGLAQTACQAQCSPQDKLAAVHGWQAQGQRVAMVGDGLNDGPVLAGADASFAFGSAVPLAQSQSDFVVAGQDLGMVVHTVLFARRTLRIVRQNLLWAAGYNALSVPFAAMGLMPAWLAGLGMALSSLLVVCNAARLARMTGGQAHNPAPPVAATAP